MLGYILETIIVLLILYEIIVHYLEKKKESHLDRLCCAICEEMKPLYKVPDDKFKLCKTCMEIYLENPEKSFSEEIKIKIRKKYRYNKNKRR